MGRLKQRECVVSPSWRLEVRDEGTGAGLVAPEAARADVPGAPPAILGRITPSLSSHAGSLLPVPVSLCLFLKEHQFHPMKGRPTPVGPHLNS